jgi:hypothetical protein
MRTINCAISFNQLQRTTQPATDRAARVSENTIPVADIRTVIHRRRPNSCLGGNGHAACAQGQLCGNLTEDSLGSKYYRKCLSLLRTLLLSAYNCAACAVRTDRVDHTQGLGCAPECSCSATPGRRTFRMSWRARAHLSVHD